MDDQFKETAVKIYLSQFEETESGLNKTVEEFNPQTSLQQDL